MASTRNSPDFEPQNRVSTITTPHPPLPSPNRTPLKLCEALPEKLLPELQGCTCEACKPELYQPLKRHPRDTPTSIIVQGFGFRQHDTWHLATLAVASFTNRQQMVRWGQMKALKDWQTWWQNGRSTHAKHLRTLELHTVDSNIFLHLAEIMNQLFFLGSLPAVKLRIEWATDDSAHGVRPNVLPNAPRGALHRHYGQPEYA